MNNLKVTKAIYHVPEIGLKQGTDVTIQLSAQIIDDRLFYNGIYNNIFPDNFFGKHKRLYIEIEYKGKNFTKFYNENEKINLPNDLGENKKQKWWEQTWVQIFFLIGGVASIITLYFYLIKF